MAQRVTKNPAAKKYALLKRRISKMQRRAKFVGFIYLMATIVFAAVTALALVAGQFWTRIAVTTDGFIAITEGLLLLIMVVDVIKALTKINWLFKKSASRMHGFNRNAYAMDDLNKIFADTFASIVVLRFVAGLLEGGLVLVPMTYILIGAGVAVHMLCGVLAGNVSLFDVQDGIVEQKRECGSFLPFVRSLVQIAVTAAVLVFAMKLNVRDVVEALLTDMNALMGDINVLLDAVGKILIVVLAVVMVKRATNTVEFDAEGLEASGKKTFKRASFFMFLIAALVYAYATFLAKVAVAPEYLTIAIVAFASFLFEALTTRAPKEDPEAIDEVESNVYLSQNYMDPGVYVMPNMVKHPVQRETILPYQGYGFETKLGMIPTKMKRK